MADLSDLEMSRFESPYLTADIYEKHQQSITDIAKLKVQEHLKVEPDYDDPFNLCDLGDVITKDRKWRELLPAIETFYAVKVNPDPVVIRLLLGLGRGFDCASKREIEMVLDAGASPDRIIYANPCKQVSHLRFAKEKGISLMTFDSIGELRKIKHVYPEAKLILRMRYDDPTAHWSLGLKFGCSLNDILGLMTAAKTLDLEIVGISFHVGSRANNPKAFTEAIAHARPFFDAGRALGHANLTLLDIGGGYPGSQEVNFEPFADAISESLEQHFPSGCGVKVIAEHGSFYIESAVHLVANVIATRDAEDDCLNNSNNDATKKAETTKKMYYLNVGMYNSFMSNFSNPTSFKPPRPARELKENEPLYRSVVWGPTCAGSDCVFPDCQLPELKTGECVIFRDMGAYAIGSDFNGFGTPATCYIAPQDAILALRQIFQDVGSF